MLKAFFGSRKWFYWSYGGSLVIILLIWYGVELNVEINHWFGSFYNLLQDAVTKPNTVKLETVYDLVGDFLKIAMVYVIVGVISQFITSHFVFRWRTALNDYYMSHWHKIRHIEGASQRVQEDTMRFADILENLGTAFISSLLTLVAFLPLLWTLGKNIKNLPLIGNVDGALVIVAILSSIVGTLVVALAGIKLPGLNFKNQKVEAAYRKELVLGENNSAKCQPLTVNTLYNNVKKNYFTLYLNYLYFNVFRISYMQVSVLIPAFMMAPSLIAGLITFGLFQQIVRAFDQVQSSFQYLVNSWSTIVEFMSIYKRLHAFEQEIHKVKESDTMETNEIT